MSPQVVNLPRFAQILADTGWADIDQLFKLCKEQNVFGSEFYDRAIEKAMKVEIRRMLKSGKLKDEDGNVIRVASIRVLDSNGKARRVYKQEMLFSVGDFIQVTHYWKDNVDRCKKKLKYYSDLATRIHGKTIQGMLPIID